MRISRGVFAYEKESGGMGWGRNSTVFHELAEVYGRTTLKMPYMRHDGSGAHDYAIQREGNYYGNAKPGRITIQLGHLRHAPSF